MDGPGQTGQAGSQAWDSVVWVVATCLGIPFELVTKRYPRRYIDRFHLLEERRETVKWDRNHLDWHGEKGPPHRPWLYDNIKPSRNKRRKVPVVAAPFELVEDDGPPGKPRRGQIQETVTAEGRRRVRRSI